MDTFDAWVRQRREQLNLTREALAGRVGCSVALLRKIEDGERRPSAQIAELLANSLNIPPAERATFVKVARGELSASRLSPVPLPGAGATATSPHPHANLPVLPTPLIGRQREVEELGQLLHDPSCRLLTLVGPGGIGKTRLAIEVASRLHLEGAFADGVYFAPLAPAHTTRLIVPVIADAMGFAFESASGAGPQTQLFSYLKEKQILLLTDNLEHLLAEPGIEVLAELLAHAPRVKLLATSRESLGLQGEWVFEVQGLPVPDGEQVSETVRDTSVELFLQRARRAYVGFNTTMEDYAGIVRICRLVGGMPLAVELAAAWVRTLSCDEIAREIERGLDFLSVTARDLPARHRSMRAVFDHSWKTLTPEEQAVLLRLSVFQGGFQREAAQQVAGATLSALSSLVTKSLLRRSGAGRYDLHELIRQFTAEHFAQHPEDQAATRARHGRHYLAFYSQADGRFRSAAQRETLADLTAEIDNFRAAWDWAVAQGEFASIEPALRALVMFYDTRGWLQEGIETLGGAIAALEPAHGPLPPDRTNQVTLGHLLAARALLATRQGQYEQAQAMLERSLEIVRPLNEPRVLVEAVTFLGMVMESTGQYDRSVALYSEGLQIATAIGDRWFAALSLTCLADEASLVQGVMTPERALEQLRAVVADWRAIGDPRLTAIALSTLSFCAMRLGRYDEARAAVDECIVLSTSLGDRWALGFGYRGLGVIAQARGEHLLAVDPFRKSLDMFTELGARQDVARVLAELSRSIFALGNDAEAGRIWRESLRMAIETRGTFIVMEALAGIASLQAKRGECESALELLLIVLNHPGSVQDTRDRAARLRAGVEARLTPTQIEIIHAHAGQKTFEAVVDDLLK